MLRENGVVGKFVEFYGAGLANLPLADRATIGNMSPEYGATCGIFPVDAETLRYLSSPAAPRSWSSWSRPTRRSRASSTTRAPRRPLTRDTLELDLGDRRAEPGGPQAPAGPRAPERGARGLRARRSPLTFGENGARPRLHDRDESSAESFPASDPPHGRRRPGSGCRPGGARRHRGGDQAHRCRSRSTAAIRARRRRRGDRGDHELHQHLQPVGDGRRRAAGQEGGRARPGAPAVGEDEPRPGLEGRDRLPRQGRPDASTSSSSSSSWSATAARPASATRVRCPRRSRTRSPRRDLSVCSVLSGNRNFEGRIHPEVKMNYLASPPLVVAYALAGRMDADIYDEPLGEGTDGEPVFLRDIWPSQQEIHDTIEHAVQSEMFTKQLRRGVRGRRQLERARRSRRATATPGTGDSTYVQAARPTSRACRREAPRRVREQSALHASSRCSATASPPTTSRRRARFRRRFAGRQVPGRARRRAQGLQLLRLAPRQPRGDDARHVRQRAAAQPARAGHRGRLHRPLAGRRGDHDLRRGDEVRGRGRAAGECWRARNTARAPRATGPPRARACWASAS